MITRIEALGFRCLHHVAQPIEPFQVLVGPSGAGTSTFVDVVRLLGDMLHVGPRNALLGDPSRNVIARCRHVQDLCWMRRGDRFELALDLAIPPSRVAMLPDGGYQRARYEVALQIGPGPRDAAIAAETLWLAPPMDGADDTEEIEQQLSVFAELLPSPATIIHEPNRRIPTGWRKVVSKIGESGNDSFRSETADWNYHFRIGPTKAALANIPDDEARFPIATWVRDLLMNGVVSIGLDLEAMRKPSPVTAPRRLLPDGSNLPWVIDELCGQDRAAFERWLDVVRKAMPYVSTVDTLLRQEDRSRYLVLRTKSGLEAPSWLVSDGALRLLALTLLPHVRGLEGTLLIEQPEAGLDPRSVQAVYEALAATHSIQVLCASHAPSFAAAARPEEVMCFRLTVCGETEITRGSDSAELRVWKEGLAPSALRARGVLE